VRLAHEEGPQLVATAKALFPGWHAFILTGLLAGLRWGESAALYRTDIDWKRGRMHVQRTWSDKAGQIEAPKDSEGRYVKASPALLETLRAHLEAISLEGQVNNWMPEQRQLVFPNKAGRVMQYSTFIEDVWQPLVAKAGLLYRKYHSTRHTSRRGSWRPARTSGGCRCSLGTRRSGRRPIHTTRATGSARGGGEQSGSVPQGMMSRTQTQPGATDGVIEVVTMRDEKWWRVRDSNPRPRRCERRALPTELTPRDHQRPARRGLFYISPWSRPNPC